MSKFCFHKNFVLSKWNGELSLVHSKNFFQSCGIFHLITCVNSHAQNGTIEQFHQHMVETGLTLLNQASMPSKYWVEAFQMAIFLIYRMPTPILKN